MKTPHKLKGNCHICSDPAFALMDRKKYCIRCTKFKKHSHWTDKELIMEFR